MDAARGLRTYLLRMNASNHLRRAVSSLTREKKGIVLAITEKDKLQFLLRVLVGCNGQVRHGRYYDIPGGLQSN